MISEKICEILIDVLIFHLFGPIYDIQGQGCGVINDSTLYNRIGQKFRQTRKSTRPETSQEELASILKVERSSISNIESGKQRPSLSMIYQFCHHYNLPLNYVLPDVESVLDLGEWNQKIEIGQESQYVTSSLASLLTEVRDD